MTAASPELDVAVAAMAAESARFVVVGGFSVIANRFVRATEDIDFLAPDDDDNDRRILKALIALGGTRLRDDEPLEEKHLIDQTHLRAKTDAGVIDIIRGGLPPLDFETVEKRAMRADYGGAEFLVAGLSSIVGFKRLAGRPRDRNDLIGLEEIHGELPVEEIPGLDS
jgi:Nucleotidyl transferase AbiEii toxin, Type IV TA system